MPIPNIAQFRAEFPELALAPDALIQRKLDAAATRCRAQTWGRLQEQGVLYLAADLLARSPEARRMRMDAAIAEQFRKEYEGLAAAVACCAGKSRGFDRL